MKLLTSVAVLSVIGTAAMADHPYAKGDENSNGVTAQAVNNGTLHPGHVSLYGTGKGDPAEGKHNTPSDEFHNGDGYDAGPGGWADTRSDK